MALSRRTMPVFCLELNHNLHGHIKGIYHPDLLYILAVSASYQARHPFCPPRISHTDARSSLIGSDDFLQTQSQAKTLSLAICHLEFVIEEVVRLLLLGCLTAVRLTPAIIAAHIVRVRIVARPATVVASLWCRLTSRL